MFDEKTDGELIKESLQEWMCDHRMEITSCESFTLNNHECSYTEWFKYVDDCSGPDELSLYCLSRKYGVHTAVYNKRYVWTTISSHLMLSDTEIFNCLAVRLIFLGQTKYGILCEIKQPFLCRMTQPTTSNKKPLPHKRDVIKPPADQVPTTPVLKNMKYLAVVRKLVP